MRCCCWVPYLLLFLVYFVSERDHGWYGCSNWVLHHEENQVVERAKHGSQFYFFYFPSLVHFCLDHYYTLYFVFISFLLFPLCRCHYKTMKKREKGVQFWKQRKKMKKRDSRRGCRRMGEHENSLQCACKQWIYSIIHFQRNFSYHKEGNRMNVMLCSKNVEMDYGKMQKNVN